MLLHTLKNHFSFSKLTLLGVLLISFSFIAISFAPLASALTMEEAIGTLDVPPATKPWQVDAEAAGASIGIIYFISRMIRLSTVIGGLYTLFMFIIAGYEMLFSQGKSGSFKEASGYFTNGVLGLAIIACAYTVTAVVSYIIYGDATFIVSPQLPS